MARGMTAPRPGAVLLLAVTGFSCAPAIVQEYGDQGLTTQRFAALDTALAPHQGSWVAVWGRPTPTPQAPHPPGVMFRGHLAGLRDGWVHLLREEGDTLRIGKHNVSRVRLIRARGGNRWLGGAVGAVGLGVIAYFVSADTRGGRDSQLAIAASFAAAGGVVGALTWPGDRMGEQLYPPPATALHPREEP